MTSLDWLLEPSSEPARDIATLTWVTVLAMCALALVVYAIIVYLIARRRRGTLAEHMPYTTKGGMGWIYVWGLAIPGVVFVGSLIASITLMFTASEHMHDEAHPDIVVTGHQWWWEVRYTGSTPEQSFITANEIHIPVGRRMLVQLRSADVIHSFWVPRLSGKVDLVPARANAIMLQADAPGRYEGQCAEFCGAEHALMRLVVVAESEPQFAVWKAKQHAPALPPREEPEIRGQEVFEKRACGLCHAVRGTHALGTVGPDLTHVGSRLMIGANAVPNDRARLQAWIVRPHALKPQMQMPNLWQLDGKELNALAAYLGSLK